MTTRLEPGELRFGGAFSGQIPGRELSFSYPVEIIRLERLEELVPFFGRLQERLVQGYALAGYIGYEAGYGFESSSFDLRHAGGGEGIPLAWFGVYRDVEYSAPAENVRIPGEGPRFDLEFELTEADYLEALGCIKERIASGDVYQVNYTGRNRFACGQGAPRELFRALCARQPQAYTAWMDLGEGCYVLSLSPELFFEVHDGMIETCPMKGTAPRGADEVEDRSLREGLARCSKNRAENLMIVDLLRNDLGRICRPGSVHADRLFTVRSYPTLHQMVSSVTGRLKEPYTLYELFAALFPCGSVTGAPKISSMQLIEQLERSPRGVYTGALGFMLPGGRMQFSVGIRTLVVQGGEGCYGTGSGIVWDSDPQEEFGECRLKAAIITGKQFSLFESLLWNGSYAWLDEHLQRLGRSAAELGFDFNEVHLRQLLDRHTVDAGMAASGGRYKVRLVLDSSGKATVTSERIGLPGMVKVCLSAVRTFSGDSMLRHKTTQREMYDRQLTLARQAGFDEVIFCNERGEVTEGAISNIIIRTVDGRYLTPPLTSGLLGGIWRSYFLRTRAQAYEEVLTLSDVRDAEQLFICNAVRGLRPAELVPFSVE